MADNSQYQDDEGALDVPTQPLSQDYDTPAAPPEETDGDKVPVDYPQTDGNMDAHEMYDEGIAGAAELNSKHVDSDDTPDERRIA